MYEASQMSMERLASTVTRLFLRNPKADNEVDESVELKMQLASPASKAARSSVADAPPLPPIYTTSSLIVTQLTKKPISRTLVSLICLLVSSNKQISPVSEQMTALVSSTAAAQEKVASIKGPSRMFRPGRDFCCPEGELISICSLCFTGEGNGPLSSTLHSLTWRTPKVIRLPPIQIICLMLDVHRFCWYSLAAPVRGSILHR